MTTYLNSLKTANKKLPYGGYLEKRNLYQSSLFINEKPARDIHLGIDVWAAAHTPIFSPLEGIVEYIKYNGNKLDYGYTLILFHKVEDYSFYTLYGHLSSSVLKISKKGQKVKPNHLIGHFGEETENGGWSPHVHFQVILDLEENIGDYPGVCSEEDIFHYKKNCPDPTIFILPK